MAFPTEFSNTITEFRIRQNTALNGGFESLRDAAVKYLMNLLKKVGGKPSFIHLYSIVRASRSYFTNLVAK